uniref:ATP-dependent RNA helicase n=1 Tax=Clastoptera arizonana TaxID=38151 RepID=A0A1B6E718_9HEMI
MVKKDKTVPTWKPVVLEGNILAGGVEGLVGIEELNDYSLITSHNQQQHKHLKRKNSLVKKKGDSNKSNSLKKIKFQETFSRDQSSLPKKVKLIGCKRAEVILNNTEESVESLKSSFLELPWSNINVPKPVIKALIEQGFSEPTEIQALTIPPAILGRRDILGAAETGSGKTLAFGIPIIYGILKNLESESEDNKCDSIEESELESDQDEIIDGTDCVKVVNLGLVEKKKCGQLWALILTPTRELAIQIKNHLVAALKYTQIKVAVVVGGMSAQKQERLLKKQPHIVVATPGRLWELVSQGEQHFANLENIKYLAIDETDRMTEVNHFPELRSLLEKINADPEKQKLRQNFVFSATLTLVHDPPSHLKKKKKNKKQKFSVEAKLKNLISVLGITNPKVVDITQKTGITHLLTESSIVCSFEQKDYYLYYFLQRHPGRTLVFCNSISCVRRLASLLNLLKCQPLPLHANMMQRQRLKNLERFRDLPNGLLLATDVAARGLDIPKVEHVIHYQVPRTSETYIHRSGRTARANNEGLTLLLIEPSEMSLYQKLLMTLKRDKEIPEFPVAEGIMSAVKERVNLARDLDQIQLAHKRTNSKVGWLEKSAQEMDILLDDDEKPEHFDDQTMANLKKSMTAKKKKLNLLLTKSLPSKFPSKTYSILNTNTTVISGSSWISQSALEIVKSNCKEENKIKMYKKRQKPKQNV